MPEKLELKAGDSQTIALDIPEGWFVTVAFTTQADYEWTVTIADSKTTYFNKSRRSNSPTPLEYGSFKTLSGNATLTISVPQAQVVKLISEKLVVEDKARTVTFIGEDSYDGDYNDLFLSIAAWKNAG